MIPYKSKGFAHFNCIQAIMGTHTARDVSAFCPSDQTHGTIENSVLTTPSSSTVIATSRAMEPPTSTPPVYD